MKHHRRRRRDGGFTFLELLVVITILGIIAAIVAPRFIGRVGPARLKAAKTQIAMFETALDTFKLDTGRYPTTEEGLKSLREKPSGVENWQGPYLPKELPADPWGRPYVYKCPGDHEEYDILSHGLDGVEGGDGENQDVTSWKDIDKK